MLSSRGCAPHGLAGHLILLQCYTFQCCCRSAALPYREMLLHILVPSLSEPAVPACHPHHCFHRTGYTDSALRSQLLLRTHRWLSMHAKQPHLALQGLPANPVPPCTPVDMMQHCIWLVFASLPYGNEIEDRSYCIAGVTYRGTSGWSSWGTLCWIC